MLISVVSLGLCGATSKSEKSTNTLPGFHKGSWGYHSDDGQKYGEQKYHAATNGSPYSLPYGINDIIGCGVDWGDGTIFFTKNGVNLGLLSSLAFESYQAKLIVIAGVAFSKVSGALCPQIGASPGAHVQVNFGAGGFKYNISKHQ